MEEFKYESIDICATLSRIWAREEQEGAKKVCERSIPGLANGTGKWMLSQRLLMVPLQK